jgi:nicotinamidase-related amidase
MPEMKTLNGYEVVDAKAREDIEALKNAEVDLTGYATESYVDEALAAIPDNGVKPVFIDASGALDVSTAIPEEYVPVFQKYISGEDRDVYFFIKLNGSTYYQPASISVESNSMTIYLPIDHHATNNPGQLYKKYLVVHLGYNPPKWWLLTNYNQLATKQYVDDAIQTVSDSKADKSHEHTLYLTKIAFNDWESEFVSDLESEYAKKTDIPEGDNVDLSNYYTKEEVNNLIPKETDLTGYATEAYVDNAIAGISGGSDTGSFEIANITIPESLGVITDEETISALNMIHDDGRNICKCTVRNRAIVSHNYTASQEDDVVHHEHTLTSMFFFPDTLKLRFFVFVFELAGRTWKFKSGDTIDGKLTEV